MEKIFTKFRKEFDLSRAMPAFSAYLKKPVWSVVSGVPSNHKALLASEIGDCVKKCSVAKKNVLKGLSRILSALKRAKKTRSMAYFQSAKETFGLCYPLLSNKRVFGFLVLCGLKKQMPPDVEKIFSAFTEAVIRGSRREMELEELNRTIRPRALALSTVHTMHRLMGTSLEINELVPRIARLSLQVIRANRCSIKLVDKKHEVLLPISTIDLRKEKTKLKKVQIGKYAPGRAVKKGMPVRGANYLSVPMIDEGAVGAITLYDKVDGAPFTEFDEEIMKTLSEQAAIAIKNAQLFKEQMDLTMSSIKCIAELLEISPHDVCRAEASCLKLIVLIGQKFKLNERETKMLQYAAMLRDTGKISIPEKVLKKRGELTGQEFEMIKTHSMKGVSILSRFKPLKGIVPVIMYHHEKFDGTGYPRGLKGKEIPIAARILAVVSSFEAMIMERPYREALSIDEAVREVRKNAGAQFDPKVVEVFCDVIKRKDVKKLLEKELAESRGRKYQ